MRGSVRRSFASGSISRSAARKHFGGYGYGTTSENSTPLTVDDGGLSDGAVGPDHIDARTNQRSGRGFENPEGDYGRGNYGSDHIDGNLTRPQYPQGAGYTKQKDRSERASTARVRAGSANEYWDASWYGAPAKRGA